MITRKTTNRFSIITICNYDQYQSTNYEKPQAEPQAEPQKSDRPTAIKPQSNHNQTAANKNDKNVKNNIGRSKRETDPRVKEFLDYWEETFQKETGQPYVFSFGKDGKLVKGLLQVHSLEILQDTVRLFFKDEQCKRRGLIIGIFYQEVNRLLSLKAMDPLEQAKRRLLKKDGLN